MSSIDPALATLLDLDPAQSTFTSAGGGGCSSATTHKLTSQQPDGTQRVYFVKLGSGSAAETMFAGEHASLNALHAAVPTLSPRSWGHGKLQDSPSKSFLVTDFLDLSAGRSKGNGMSLAQKLAKLHTTPAPVQEGYDRPQFGFPVPTCCGDTCQDNTFSSSWADFYSNSRLRFIVRQSVQSNGKDDELTRLVERMCTEVVPRLLGDDHLNNGRGVPPVVVHGDLWSGNASTGLLPGMSEPEAVAYDPSACYAHSEYELGIMKMFGGFRGKFLDEYHQLCPKTEPVGEYDDRVALYELYHHLNHHAMFGGGYRSGAVSMMKRLIRAYGLVGA